MPLNKALRNILNVKRWTSVRCFAVGGAWKSQLDRTSLSCVAEGPVSNPSQRLGGFSRGAGWAPEPPV